jgi:predicted nucleotidyltransferase
MTDVILNKEIQEMLEKVQKVFLPFGIDFYIVGAIARDIHLSRGPLKDPLRKTKDVDIAIMIADEAMFYEVKDALINTGEFKAHPAEAIKLFYQDRIELDLLPFGGIENNQRETIIKEPKIFVMDMPGFMEILPSAEIIKIAGNIELKICSLEGLVLLKLFAYDDNPVRTKDITDIAHIIRAYFDLNENDIFEAHPGLFAAYDVNSQVYLESIAARVIGIKINSILHASKSLRQRAIDILLKKGDEKWTAIAEGLVDE